MSKNNASTSKTDALRNNREQQARRPAPVPAAAAPAPAKPASIPAPVPAPVAAPRIMVPPPVASAPDAAPSAPESAPVKRAGKRPAWRLSPAHSRAVRLRRSAARLTASMARADKFTFPAVDPSTGDNVGNAFALAREEAGRAVHGLLRAAEYLELVPMDWRPSMGERVSQPAMEIAVGCHVAVRSAKVPTYDGLGFTPGDLAHLVVVSAAPKMIGAQVRGAGALLFFPRSHLKHANGGGEGT